MTFFRSSALLVLALIGLSAQAQEATIRKNLVARLPNLPTIEAITPVPGTPLYEVLLSGNDIVYTDVQANVLIQGTVYDTGVGLAGGPYGDPNRFDLGAWGEHFRAC